MMKRQIKKKTSVIVFAALCVWSTQAVSALDGRDGIVNCKVFSNNGTTGAKYYLRQVPGSSGVPGTLVYTTDSTKATKFTFSRKEAWKHDTGGTAYYMTGGPGGGCVGLWADTTVSVGTPVLTNFTCAENSSKRLVIDALTSTRFTIRVEAKTGYWFDGWGGLVDGAQIKLNTAQNGGAFGNNQKFGTTGCTTATGDNYLPKGGT